MEDNSFVSIDFLDFKPINYFSLKHFTFSPLPSNTFIVHQLIPFISLSPSPPLIASMFSLGWIQLIPIIMRKY